MGEHAPQAGTEGVQLFQSLSPMCPLSQDTLVSPLLFTEHLLQQSLFLRLTQVPHQAQPLDNQLPCCTSRAHCFWFFPCRTSATFLVMPALCNCSLSHWSIILFRSSSADVVPITAAAQPGPCGAYHIPAISRSQNPLRGSLCSEHNWSGWHPSRGSCPSPGQDSGSEAEASTDMAESQTPHTRLVAGDGDVVSFFSNPVLIIFYYEVSILYDRN